MYKNRQMYINCAESWVYMPNKRTAKTKREIKHAFICLLNKKPINKITVNEISELAEISRSTFYLHFEDVYMVYNSIANDIIEELVDNFLNSRQNNRAQTLINRLNLSIDYITENKELFKTMINNGNILAEIHRISVIGFLNEFYPNGHTEYGIIEVNFVAWGLIGTLENYVISDNIISKEKINTILMHILARFIDGINL